MDKINNVVEQKDIIEQKEVIEVKEVSKKPERVPFKNKFTGDMNHFNKDYNFITKNTSDYLEIFILNESGNREWCLVESTHPEVEYCLENCFARVKR